MIQKLEIENYQSHKNTTLNFSPGVNAIIGQSDSGKTSILRALRWVIENRPGGDAFRSSWGGKTSVKITTGQNVIERVKDKTTVNTYALSTGEEDLSFAAMGTSVPEEVQNALNINQINYQNQLDRPFLLDNSPGEVAAHFNKIAHLDVIDVGLRNVKSWISGLTKTISIEEIRVAELEEEQSQYDYLPAMEKAIITLETLHAHLYKMSEDFIDFEKLKLSIIKTNSNIDQYANLLSLEPAVLLTLEQARVIFDKKTIRENLTRSVQNINKTDEEIIAGKGVLKLEKLVTGTFILIQKEKAVQNEKRLLTGVVSGIKTTTQTLKTSITRRDELQKEFNENFPEVCPLCFRVVEKWKSVLGYEKLYEVSNLGNVRSYYSGTGGTPQLLEQTPKCKAQVEDCDGYKKVSLYGKSQGLPSTCVGVHRLVLEAFVGKCPIGKEASHKDGDRTNNTLDNLIWETHLENENRKKEHNTRPLFSNSKLTEEDVREIRKMYIPYKISQAKLAKKYGVCENTIWAVVNNRIWEWVK